MASRGGESAKNRIVRYCAIWTAVFGALTAAAKFATELPNLPLLSQKHRWVAYFLPDLALLLLFAGVAAISLYGARHQFLHVLRTGRRLEAAVVVTLGAAVAILVIPIGVRVWRLERARVLSAKFDWHYYRGRQAIRQGEAYKALREFKLQGEGFTYLGVPFQDGFHREFLDIQARVREADGHAARFEEAERTGGVSFADVLRVQRAVVLCADCPRVLAVCEKAKSRLQTAVQEYWSGVTALREKQWAEAARRFAASEKICSHLLDAGLLRDYARVRTDGGMEAADRLLLAHYMSASLEELQDEIHNHPLIAAMRALPRIERTAETQPEIEPELQEDTQ